MTPDVIERSSTQPRPSEAASSETSRSAPASTATVMSQEADGPSLDFDTGTPDDPVFVYAIGRVEPRFPSLGLEKEFAQVTRRAPTAGLTDRQVVHSVLSEGSNRYLARQLCWVFTIEGLETYILSPRDPADLDLLVESLRPVVRSSDVDVVIGVLGPVAPPTTCNGAMLPIVVFDQLYSFDVEGLVKSIPRPEAIEPDQFESAAEELFTRIMQMADNAGATDDDRALNYLSVRDPRIYAKAAEAFAANSSLSSVEVRPSRLSASRNVAEVIFCFTNRDTGVDDKYFVRVDVTEEFPFLVSPLSPFFDR